MNGKKNPLNSREFVLNAFEGKSQEVTPLALILSLYGSKLISCSSKHYYSNPEAYFKGQEMNIELFNPDIITSPFALPFEGEVFGSEIGFIDKMPPQLKKPAINSYNEIVNLKTSSFNSGSKAYCLEATRLLISQYKREKFIAGITLSCIDACTMVMGVEGFLDTLLFHPKELHLLFEKTSRHFIDYTNALFELGVDVVILPSSFCSPTMVTEKIIEEVTLIPLQNALKELNGPVLIHHGSAINLKFLHYFVDLPNVAGFIIDNRENLNSARNIVGKKLLIGNMNNATILNKPAEVVARTVKRILRNQALDSQFVFCNAGPDIPYETPIENLKTIYETVRSFKKNK